MPAHLGNLLHRTSPFNMSALIKTAAIVIAVFLILVSSTDAYVILYEHPNYTGRRRIYVTARSFVGSSFNDQTSSVRVTPGQVWVLYEHSRFRGMSFYVRHNYRYVGRRFDDKTSSLRRIR